MSVMRSFENRLVGVIKHGLRDSPVSDFDYDNYKPEELFGFEPDGPEIQKALAFIREHPGRAERLARLHRDRLEQHLPGRKKRDPARGPARWPRGHYQKENGRRIERLVSQTGVRRPIAIAARWTVAAPSREGPVRFMDKNGLVEFSFTPKLRHLRLIDGLSVMTEQWGLWGSLPKLRTLSCSLNQLAAATYGCRRPGSWQRQQLLEALRDLAEGRAEGEVINRRGFVDDRWVLRSTPIDDVQVLTADDRWMPIGEFMDSDADASRGARGLAIVLAAWYVKDLQTEGRYIVLSRSTLWHLRRGHVLYGDLNLPQNIVNNELMFYAATPMLNHLGWVDLRDEDLHGRRRAELMVIEDLDAIREAEESIGWVGLTDPKNGSQGYIVRKDRGFGLRQKARGRRAHSRCEHRRRLRNRRPKLYGRRDLSRHTHQRKKRKKPIRRPGRIPAPDGALRAAQAAQAARDFDRDERAA